MIEQIATQAKKASISLAALSSQKKNTALSSIIKALSGNEDAIITANQADLEQAQRDTIKDALLKRLKFDAAKLKDSIEGIRSLIALPDPVGTTLDCTELDKGLELYRVSSPIGVLGIVFESRPDALIQISTLALKSGNAVLLKGGSEAAQTNRVLADIICKASSQAGLPKDWMALLESRADVKAMLALDKYIDLVIPRGSNAFVKYIMDNTRIPVLGHTEGICHLFIDRDADMEKAIRIAYDSKCQYPAACNSIETLLVDRKIAPSFLPRIRKEYEKDAVELRGDKSTREIIDCAPATEEDWHTEYNDLILSIRLVDGIDEAIEHINTYGSRHTDAIVSEDEKKARTFIELIDSADVFWNCSTRFSDGFRYGLGAEVGISTNKIHARGPVGLKGLLTYKWKLIGNGHIVADYSGPDSRSFTHKKLEKKFGSS